MKRKKFDIYDERTYTKEDKKEYERFLRETQKRYKRRK